MDPARFSDSKSGQLRKFVNPQTDKTDWYFLPDELPPGWEFPVRLWPLLADAKEALGTLNGIGQTLKNPDLLLRPLQNREAITSSSIEGTYVTPHQLLLYELDPKEPHSAEGELADWREVFNYRSALILGCGAVRDGPILNQTILDMHQKLMSGVRGARKSPGAFRRIQVQIGASGKFVPPPPHEVGPLMGNLEKYVNQRPESLDPLVHAFITHYQIEAIHPFADGNGRIGRVLLALMVFKGLQHRMPWLYMSSFFERHKEEYTDRLFRVSTHADWEGWTEFCLYGAISQARDAIRRCARIRDLCDEYKARIEHNGSPRSHPILEWLLESPVVTAVAAASKFKVSYKTALRDLQQLADVGILREVEDSRPKSFYAHELFRIAYADLEEDATESEDGSEQ
jgi:Fic family protein